MVQVIKVVSRGVAYRVPGGQGIGLQGPRGSRGRTTGSQRVKGKAYRVSGGQGVDLKGSKGSRGRLQGPRGISCSRESR